MNFLNWYTKMLVEKPYTTKCISSFITFGLGDVICQTFEMKADKSKSFNWMRAFRQGTFGVLMTPYLHLQFNVIIPKYFPPSAKFSLAKILLYDQTINASVFIFAFFTYLDLCCGMEIKESLKNTLVKFPETIVANWKLWPMAQIINFTIMPPPYRVFFANIVGLFWNTYLSYVQNVKSKAISQDSKQNKLI